VGFQQEQLACSRLSKEESAASKAALENVKPDSATIQSMMQAFITSNAEARPFQGEVCARISPLLLHRDMKSYGRKRSM